MVKSFQDIATIGLHHVVLEHIPLQGFHNRFKENCTIFEMLFWDSWNFLKSISAYICLGKMQCTCTINLPLQSFTCTNTQILYISAKPLYLYPYFGLEKT
jgi:hypothetical protein